MSVEVVTVRGGGVCPDLDRVLANAARVARDCFKKNEEIATMWVGHQANGDMIIVMPEPFHNAKDKDLMVEQTRLAFKHHKVVMFSYMSEAWMLHVKRDDELVMPSGSLEHHPDRREIIAVQAEDQDRCLLGHYYILRPEFGPPTLSPFKRLSDSGPSSGRMIGLLK